MSERPARQQFAMAHATHSDWHLACELVAAQFEGQARTHQLGQLGMVYISGSLQAHSADILALLRARTGVLNWVGSGAYAVAIGSTEYADEPAIAAMLADVPETEFQVFSGLNRPPALDAKTSTGHWAAHCALVHADPMTPELNELVQDMAAKTELGFAFGGLSSRRDANPDDPNFVQIANHTLHGGLSGVMFSSGVHLITRVTQGCMPIAREHAVTRVQQQYIRELNGRPALDVLLEDLDVPEPARQSLDGNILLKHFPRNKLRGGLFAGVVNTAEPTKRSVPADMSMRQVLGIDPVSRIVVLSEAAQVGQRLTFCTRDEDSTRRDLVRACAEIREELDASEKKIRGAHWVSCVARAGAVRSELEVISEQLGEISLIGFYANGEIARDRLFAYTGVLTVFTD
jgi:small ligand-binding sensory domain FIST